MFATDLAASLPGPDGRMVTAEGQSWRVSLRGQRVDAQHRSVHLTLYGEPEYWIVLRVSGATKTREAVRALEWWLGQPGRENGDVIDVEWA